MSVLSDAKNETIQRSYRSGGKIRFTFIQPLIAVADVIIVLLTAVAGGVAYHQVLHRAMGDAGAYVGLGLITGVLYVISAHRMRLYCIQEVFRTGRDYQRVLTSWAFAILVMAVILFVLKIGASVSRGSVICFAVAGVLCLPSWRKLVKRRLRRALQRGAIHARRAIVLGEPSELAPFRKYDLLARFGVEEIERISLPRCGGTSTTPVLTVIEKALQRARDCSAEEVVLALTWADEAQLDLVRSQLRKSPLPVRLLPDRTVSAVLEHETAGVAKSLLVEIQRAPLTAAERLVKRTLDVAVAGTAIVMTAPLMALCAVAIKASSAGPVVFCQRRKGFNGREFVIYKFRTMTVLEDGASIVQARKSDPRITGVGRLLRQSSIDELPQLFNVIKGDMSVVGPRPHAVAHDDEYGRFIANYAFRHHVKPGITGWAQVHGYRGETPRVELMRKRVDLDLWYVNNWSVGLDLQIIMRTFFELIRRRNAY